MQNSNATARNGRRTRFRKNVLKSQVVRTALSATLVTMAAGVTSATAQTYTWGGAGSTTTTTDYNLGTNWSNPPASAPPVNAGQAANFDATGSATVSVTAGPITPDSWTFTATSQSYTVTGQNVNFHGGALTNNASAGQAISISNNMTGVLLSQAGASTLTVSGTNSFTTTTVSAGTLVNTGSLTSAVGISAGGTFTNSLTVTGTVDNAGTFNNNAAGTVSGLLTNTAGTTTNAGQLNGGATISGGTLAITGTGTISGNPVTVGTSALAATLDISGATAGVSLQGLNGSTGGVVTLGNNTLTLSNPSNAQFSGVIGGHGGLTLTSGMQTLAGTNTYIGATTINGGMLNVTGSIFTSATTVNTGGTLMGTGNVGPVTVNNGGIIAPGNGTAGSSMFVSSLVMHNGSTLQVNLDPTTSSVLNVIGAVTVNSGFTINANFAPGGYLSKGYTILTFTSSNALAGDFTTVTHGLPSNASVILSLTGTELDLFLALSFVPPTGPGVPSAPGFPSGLNQNQQNVANALVGFFNSNGGIPMVFAALNTAGLTQVSGESATGTQQTTFNAMGQFMGVMTDPFMAGRNNDASTGGTVTSYADEATASAKRNPNDALAAIYAKAQPRATPFEARWSTWVAGYGGSQTTNGNATTGSNSTTSNVYGTAVGADYRFSPFTIAGFSLAGGGTNFSVNGAGSGHSDLFQAGAFIRHDAGAAYISGALAYGWQDITTNRTVTAAGIDQLQARFNANAYSGRIEGGYRFVSPWIGGIGVTPYAAGQFTTFNLPAYAEQALVGTNTFALAYGSTSVTDTRSELGIRTDKSWAMQDAVLTLRSRFAWAHDYNPDRSVGATFQTLPGASFVVNGAAQAADSALTTASVELKWANNWSVAGTFEGEFSGVTSSYAGKGVVRYVW
jgi:uncharacterized protein with beta-barrel porin domain